MEGELSQNPEKPLPHVSNLKVFSDTEYLVIDDSSRRNLEITWNLKDGSTQYTLLETLQNTKTAMGSRLLRNRLMYPLTDVEKIKQWEFDDCRNPEDIVLLG